MKREQNKNWLRRPAAVLCLAALMLLAVSASAFELTYEGYLSDLNDDPLDGAVAMRFALFTQATGGEAIWEEGHNAEVRGGQFAVRLGNATVLPDDPPARMWLEVQIEDDVIDPRTQVGGAMFAQRAAVADDVPGRDITPRTVSIQGVGEVIDEDGNWVGSLAETDGDGDGFADVVEVLLGSDPDDRNDAPADDNDDGIPDQLQGTPGDGANAEEVAALLREDTGFREALAMALYESYADELRGEDADPNEVALALSLDDTFRDLLALTLVSEYAEQLRGPQGPPGEGGALISPVVLGEVAPGDTFDSLDTPAVIPDANDFGFNSSRFVNEDIEIDRLTVNVEVAHPDMGDIHLTLYSPSGAEILLYDGELDGQEDLAVNIGRDLQPIMGHLDDVRGQGTQGLWRLQAVDDVPGNAGRLVSWSLNFNEGWTDGRFFAGERIETDGEVVVRGELRTERGADFVMYNTAGDEVFRVDGEEGGGDARIRDTENNLVGQIVFSASTNHFLVRKEGIAFLVEFGNTRIARFDVYYDQSSCQGNGFFNSGPTWWSALPTLNGDRLVRGGLARQSITYRSYRDTNGTCRNAGPSTLQGLPITEVTSAERLQELAIPTGPWIIDVGY